MRLPWQRPMQNLIHTPLQIKDGRQTAHRVIARPGARGNGRRRVGSLFDATLISGGASGLLDWTGPLTFKSASLSRGGYPTQHHFQPPPNKHRHQTISRFHQINFKLSPFEAESAKDEIPHIHFPPTLLKAKIFLEM